jgi:hypothetical protein
LGAEGLILYYTFLEVVNQTQDFTFSALPGPQNHCANLPNSHMAPLEQVEILNMETSLNSYTLKFVADREKRKESPGQELDVS